MRKLRVGTDCSGIEAPIQALLQLKIPFKHVFSSDIDKYCIQSIKANYSPEIIFGDTDGPYPEGDITKRDIEDIPDIDLYVCGFPCQPFSHAGRRKGFRDKRGNVFWSCLEVIEEKQPKYFMLENVKGLLSHDKGNTWGVIWEALSDLERFGYTVKWKVLNTRDYGIPQSRERVFIVGVKGGDFEWPKKKKMPLLSKYIDNKDRKYQETVRLYRELQDDSIFIDVNFLRQRKFVNSGTICPCLNTVSGLWNVPLHRYANTKEYLKLQGFPAKFKQVVSNTQLKKQVGNSMSVNVVKEILKKIFI